MNNELIAINSIVRKTLSCLLAALTSAVALAQSPPFTEKVFNGHQMRTYSVADGFDCDCWADKEKEGGWSGFFRFRGAPFESLGLRDKAALGEPTEVWNVKTPDGAGLGGALFPVHGKQDTMSLRVAILPKWPGWRFFRLRTSDGVRIDSLLYGFRLRLQPLGSVPTTMRLLWPDGECSDKEIPSWSSKTPTFDALAFHGKGNGEDNRAQFLLFEQSQVKAVSILRWVKAPDYMVLSISLNPGSDYVFALCETTGEDARAVLIPRFMKERQALHEVMAKIIWEPPVDLSKGLAEAEEMLKTVSDPALRKRFESLRAAKPSPGSELRLKKLLDDLAEAALAEEAK